MTQMGVPKRLWKFVIIGVVVHLLLFVAVFDIYFVSPIQQGMVSHKSPIKPLAQRLVLFVADGFRAESFFNDDGIFAAKYLHSIKNGKSGSWGISHTHVPTESRPGHIAMLAGFTEDPSAITRGWQSNPVDFDSVINQSANAWCWGSPDILNMFKKYNSPHIHLDSYDHSLQDFSGKSSAALLDTWVFDRVDEFFDNESIKKLESEFLSSGNIFFLHLLGLDTAGHSIKPTSKEYVNNIMVVDKGIKEVISLFEKNFPDGETAYIVTADHGMTNWGSHGAGSSHETEVPFIAWGTGIADNKFRLDINQVDIAPLISSLLGLNIPVNSLGIVPLDYLNASKSYKAHMIFTNVLQLSEQYIMKHTSLKRNILPLIFQPFSPLPSRISVVERLSELNGLFRMQRYDEIITGSYNLMELFKDGLKYYRNYYQHSLLILMSTGFVGWILYLISSMIKLSTSSDQKLQSSPTYSLQMRNVFLICIYACGALVVFMTLFSNNLPVVYYLYICFPIITWTTSLRNCKQVAIDWTLLRSYLAGKLLFQIVFCASGVYVLVASFSKPYYLTLAFAYFAYNKFTTKKPSVSLLFSIVVLFLLGICPKFLGLQTEFSIYIQLFSFALWLVYGYSITSNRLFSRDTKIFQWQLIILAVAFINTLCVDISMNYGEGLLLINQLISWFILAVTFVLPMFVSTRLENRLASITISLITPYTLMASGYESVFMFFFTQFLLKWILIEHKEIVSSCACHNFSSETITSTHTTEKSIERCFYLLAFTMLAYFGVGNTASINSFDPMWVRCFVTMFSPFTMMALILCKLIIPFLIVMCSFRGVMIITKAQTEETFLILLLLCDLMVVPFLYSIKNEGSWEEIGTSLSLFVVVNVTTIILLIFYGIAIILTNKDLRKRFNKQLHSRSKNLEKC